MGPQRGPASLFLVAPHAPLTHVVCPAAAPQGLKPRKVKNIEYNAMGDKTGRVHMQKQELETLQLRKIKALKKDRRSAKRGASAPVEDAEDGDGDVAMGDDE